MKNLLILALLFSTGIAFAAKTGDDSFQIGNPSSSVDKKLIFDTGDGASNKYILLDHSLKELSTNVDKLTLGTGAAANQSVIFNRGGSNPTIRWNESNSVLEFSNDGTSFTNIGSGSGGSAGLNLLTTNPDFEQSLALGWTATGLSFTAATSGSNLLFGKQSAIVDSSATGQKVASDLYAIPNGLKGQACSASVYYLGGDSTYTLEVVDGSSAIVASQPFPTATTTPFPFTMTFQCPSSGSISLVIASTANGAAMAIDRAFLGELSGISQVSQASFVGGVIWDIPHAGAGAFGWSDTSSTLHDADSDTFATAPLIVGTVTAAPSSQFGATVPAAGPGEYEVIVQFAVNYSAGGYGGAFVLVDENGTNIGGNYLQIAPTGNNLPSVTLIGHANYTTAGTHTFHVQVAQGNVSFAYGSAASAAPRILIYRHPASSQLAYTPATSAWFADASYAIYSMANTSGYYQAGVALTQNPGSVQTLVPCSGTNPPDATGTCVSGTSENGISFNLPVPGMVRVCANLSPQMEANGGANANFDYTIDQTANADDTVVVKAGLNQSLGQSLTITVFNTTNRTQALCENFNEPAAGLVTFRLNQVASGITAGSAGPTEWFVYPLTQQIPMPVLINSVVSSSAGVEGIHRLAFGGAGTIGSPANCTSDPCTIYSQDGAWVSSVNFSSTGQFVVNFAAGTYSAPPVCTAAFLTSSTIVEYTCGTTTNSSTNCYCRNNNTPTDCALSIMCMGPK